LQDTQFRAATPSRVRLLVFLAYVATGSNYRVLESLFGLGVSNICKCVHDVSKKMIIHMSKQYIRLPTPLEAIQSMNAWNSQTGIPGIAGCIDGTHIVIEKPCKNGEVYFNRKGYYSLNVQGLFSNYCF